MRTPLTPKQTSLLKEKRKTMSHLERVVDELSESLCDGCLCDMDTERCYICAVLSVVFDIKELAGRAAIRLDSALEGREFPEFSESRYGKQE